MLTYFLIGVGWSWWLEVITTNKLDPQTTGKPWIWTERVFHISLWPWSLGTFIYAFIREYKKRK
jgi:hypothetical protein